jgi:hypothetical protein
MVYALLDQWVRARIQVCRSLCHPARTHEILQTHPQVHYLISQALGLTCLIHRELYRQPKGKQLALDTFAEHRSFYHPQAARMIAKDLELI